MNTQNHPVEGTLDSKEGKPTEPGEEIYDGPNVDHVIAFLRERVKNLRAAAMITMGLMAFAMVGGFVVFYAAGEIVARENLDSYQQAIGVQGSLQSAQTEFKKLAGSLQELEKEKTQEITAKLDQIESKITSITPVAQKIVEAIPDEQKRKSELNSHISIFSMITRVSAGIILIFLVQILVKMYRYNVRLAAFYEGRADALQLAANLNSASIERAAKLLGPESIDFGEMPEPPSKQVIELVKQLGGLLVKKDG